MQTDMFMNINVCTARESNPRPLAQGKHSDHCANPSSTYVICVVGVVVKVFTFVMAVLLGERNGVLPNFFK
jgi:hypothetical protein